MADGDASGLLNNHLKGYRFVADPEADSDTPRAARSVPVKRGRSGVHGCVTRERQLSRKEYKWGSKEHRILKRGVDVSERIRKGNERPRESGRRSRSAG